MIDTLGDSFMLVHAICQKDYVFAKLWYFITLDSQYSCYAVDEDSRALLDFDPIHTSFEEKARDAKHLQDAANNRKQNHNLMFDSTSHQQWHTSDDQTASCSSGACRDEWKLWMDWSLAVGGHSKRQLQANWLPAENEGSNTYLQQKLHPRSVPGSSEATGSSYSFGQSIWYD